MKHALWAGTVATVAAMGALAMGPGVFAASHTAPARVPTTHQSGANVQSGANLQSGPNVQSGANVQSTAGGSDGPNVAGGGGH